MSATLIETPQVDCLNLECRSIRDVASSEGVARPAIAAVESYVLSRSQWDAEFRGKLLDAPVELFNELLVERGSETLLAADFDLKVIDTKQNELHLVIPFSGSQIRISDLERSGDPLAQVIAKAAVNEMLAANLEKNPREGLISLLDQIGVHGDLDPDLRIFFHKEREGQAILTLPPFFSDERTSKASHDDLFRFHGAFLNDSSSGYQTSACQTSACQTCACQTGQCTHSSKC